MKFPRNARIFRGQLDAAPFASVLFVLLMFAVVGSVLYTPGIHIRLPEMPPDAQELPGTDRPTISVAMIGNTYYYEHQEISESALKTKLRELARRSREPLTLLIYTDKDVTVDRWTHLALVAREAGINDFTLPIVSAPASPGTGSHR